MARIVFQNVTKFFPRKPGQKWLRSFLSDLAKREATSFRALNEVSFSIQDGQSVALVGRNGAGKSTVLNMVAGLMFPSSGSIEMEGTTAALLDLGAGFHGDLTGRENLAINSALLGLTKHEVRLRTGSIIEFSGLGEFIDQPLRTYSSGMTMRLAFSVAISVEPDILLIDEVLAVGDTSFQSRCMERIRDLKRSGKIFLCVSHSLAIDQLCDTAIWLEQGRVRKIGQIADVLQTYENSLSENVEIRQHEDLSVIRHKPDKKHPREVSRASAARR